MRNVTHPAVFGFGQHSARTLFHATHAIVCTITAHHKFGQTVKIDAISDTLVEDAS